jgi:hypothetical protein
MWTDNDNSILIEYCKKKITIKEISIALNKTENDVKFHIGDLAFEEINKNNYTTQNNKEQKIDELKKQCCEKYNLTLQQLEGAITRNQRKQNNTKYVTKDIQSSIIDDQTFRKEVLKLLREIRNNLKM